MNTYSRRHLSIKQKIESHLSAENENGCREWLGMRSAKGYGCIKLNGKRRRVQRVLWEEINGPIPDGMFVCHTCDNAACCNDAHFFLGTNDDNIADKVAKGRQARAHRKLTEDNARTALTMREQGHTLKEIGEQFGVSPQAVHYIVTGRSFGWMIGDQS